MPRAFLTVLVVWMLHTTCFATKPVLKASQQPDDVNLSALQLQLLQKGARVPWTGILILQDDLVKWKFRIEELEYELSQVRQLHTRILQVETTLTERKLVIERERTTLIQNLWKDRAEELGDELQKTQEQLLRAQEIDWWEHPALWMAVGVVITSGAGLLILSISGK